MKKLEEQEQKEIICLIHQEQAEQVWARACSGGTREGEGVRENVRGGASPRGGSGQREL